jgi:hypothetical protein
MRVERVALRVDTSATWALERILTPDDPLGPAMASVRPTRGALITRLVRAAFTGDDSTFARGGGTVVRWDSTSAVRPQPQGLAVGDDVVVASLARRALPAWSKVRAHWADGSAAATEIPLGSGCLREIGVELPAAGDIALHPPFQIIARALLAPCGIAATERAADSTTIAWLAGTTRSAARAVLLRGADDRPSPLAAWLLTLAIVLALAELFVRAQAAPEAA